MKKRVVWLVVSCLMVLSLVLASCGTAEEEEEVVVVTPEEEEVVVPPEEEEVVTPEEEVVAEEEEVALAPEEPKYGGVLTIAMSSSPSRFDECYGAVGSGGTLDLTNEELIGGDWTKGPAGTGEATWLYPAMFPPPHLQVGVLADSWELTDPDTMVFHIREGIHWQDKPPVNGREFVADDVVYTLLRYWDSKMCPRAHMSYYPWKEYMQSITAPDKYTVVIKWAPGQTSVMYPLVTDLAIIVAHEVVETYGDMNDWERVVGTGPFMFENYVQDSSWTLVRNPNYWDKDPVGPGKGNQLPYLDGVKGIIIPDMSTRMAALRTAKVDWLTGVTWEDAEDFMERQPELKYASYINPGSTLFMRVDKPELPFHDKRVRQALALAINNPEIADTYYGGNAEVYVFPVAPVIELEDSFTPFEELPESTQELHQYHPEKAKQLLAEAGYPDGFKTEILITAAGVDLMSIIKAYWEEIGVDLTLDVKEAAIKGTVGWKKSHKEMYLGSVLPLTPYWLAEVDPGHMMNYSIVNDPRSNEALAALNAAYFNDEERNRLLKEFTPYLLDQSYFIVLPGSYQYVMWQPWLKNYHGERQMGLVNQNFAKWIWLDQDLKEEMTGRR